MAAKNSVRVAMTNNAAKDDAFSGATIDWLAEGGSLVGTLSVLDNDPGSAHLLGVHGEKPTGSGLLLTEPDDSFTVNYGDAEYTGYLTANDDGTVGFDLSELAGDLDLAEGESLEVSFFYTAQMGRNGALSTAEVTVELTGVGEAGDLPDPQPGGEPGGDTPVLIANGAFEDGFADWSTIGSTTTTDFSDLGGSDVTAGDGSQFAALSTEDMNFGGTIATESEIEAFLGIADGSLDGLIAGDAFNGSAIKTTVHLEANDTLSFDYRFDTQDAGVNDFAFFSVASTDPQLVSDVVSVGDGGDSGWQTYSFVATAAGDYEVGVGVANDTDGAGWSFLYVDNFAIA